METVKEKVFAYFDYFVSDILYYDRKHDEELPVGYIEDAIKRGEFTIDEFVDGFADKLYETLESLTGKQDV